MKNINILFAISLFMIIQTSCATLNKAQGEIHYNNNISKGQELQDLKKALDNRDKDFGDYRTKDKT